MSNEFQPMTSRSAALHYGSLGLKVLPLHEAYDDGSCSCEVTDCSRPGKHARVRTSLATFCPEEIQAWWTEWPNANVGLATGVKADLFVIEAGPRYSQALWALLDGPGRPRCFTYATRADGVDQYYFAFPPGSFRITAARLPKGLRLIAGGGVAVAPPSGGMRWMIAPEWGEPAPRPPQRLADAVRPRSTNGRGQRFILDARRTDGREAIAFTNEYVMAEIAKAKYVRGYRLHPREKFVLLTLAADETLRWDTALVRAALGERCSLPDHEVEVTLRVLRELGVLGHEPASNEFLIVPQLLRGGVL